MAIPRRRWAASRVLRSRTAMVIGPITEGVPMPACRIPPLEIYPLRTQADGAFAARESSIHFNSLSFYF